MDDSVDDESNSYDDDYDGHGVLSTCTNPMLTRGPHNSGFRALQISLNALPCSCFKTRSIRYSIRQ